MNCGSIPRSLINKIVLITLTDVTTKFTGRLIRINRNEIYVRTKTRVEEIPCTYIRSIVRFSNCRTK
ncbi:hypothetical protein SAMN05444416_10416 [Thermoactinomyces sp. DSM 45892]|nr:hypothetical protein SAMN05444416_10416 [Thermoactinomyces sp. DSM 45892]